MIESSHFESNVQSLKQTQFDAQVREAVVPKPKAKPPASQIFC